jgi:hypothetical protein
MGAGSSSRTRLSTAESNVFSSSSSSSSALPSPGPGPYQVIGRAAGHRDPAVPLTIDEEGKVDFVTTEAGTEQHSAQWTTKSVSHDLQTYSSSQAKNGLNSREASAVTKAGSRREHGQVQASVWEWLSDEDSDEDADSTGCDDEAQILVGAIRAAARLAGGSLKEALSSVSKDGILAADDFVSALWDWVRVHSSRTQRE